MSHFVPGSYIRHEPCCWAKHLFSYVGMCAKIAGPVWGPGEALAFRLSDKDLKAKFDQGIAAALADGTVKRLSLKWLKVDATP